MLVFVVRLGVTVVVGTNITTRVRVTVDFLVRVRVGIGLTNFCPKNVAHTVNVDVESGSAAEAENIRPQSATNKHIIFRSEWLKLNVVPCG